MKLNPSESYIIKQTSKIEITAAFAKIKIV